MSTGRILSIGYGNLSRVSFLEHIRRAKVGYVIDIRTAPYSRHQPDFSREPLERFLHANRIQYVFMGDLLGGRPDDDDCYTGGKVDYTKTRTKDFFVRGLARLKHAYEQGLTVCLMCSEEQPSQCHRAKLVGTALADERIEVQHLLPDGSSCSQSEVIFQLTNGQPGLFGEHLLSRKVYR
jgi:uncharacterized protein (DUF488 family)